jgi:hypothetical protein
MCKRQFMITQTPRSDIIWPVYILTDWISTRLDYMYYLKFIGGGRGRDRMVVGFITTNAISAYHH